MVNLQVLHHLTLFHNRFDLVITILSNNLAIQFQCRALCVYLTIPSTTVGIVDVVLAAWTT